MTAIRVAIVGLGKIARDQHIPAIAGTPGIELTAVAAAMLRSTASRTLKPSTNCSMPCPISMRWHFVRRPQVRQAQAAAALRAGKHVRWKNLRARRSASSRR